MTATTPIPAPVPVKPLQPARKVVWASIATYVGTGAALGALDAVSGHLDVISAALPPWANAVIAPVLPTLLTAVIGYLTKQSANDAKLPTA